jgi:hypothetical protein
MSPTPKTPPREDPPPYNELCDAAGPSAQTPPAPLGGYHSDNSAYRNALLWSIVLSPILAQLLFRHSHETPERFHQIIKGIRGGYRIWSLGLLVAAIVFCLLAQFSCTPNDACREFNWTSIRNANIGMLCCLSSVVMGTVYRLLSFRFSK